MPILRAAVLTACVAALTLPTALQAQRDAERDAWQRVPDVLAAMAIGEGSRVADVGAGRGFFTVRLAEHVGSAGLVYAVDIDETSLNRLRGRVETDGLLNVEVIRGVADDPRLPSGVVDAVLVVDAYHEMTEYGAMLAGMYAALKPGGRLVMLDYQPADPSASRSGQTARHTIAADVVERELLQAGFEIVQRDESFADAQRNRSSRRQQWLLVARRPLDPPGPL
jgi:ubiquinone/menaquinone biosynthesis C-methylase UbiE